MIKKSLLHWTNKTVNLSCLTTTLWCSPTTWKNSKKSLAKSTSNFRNCKKSTRTSYWERRILIASAAAKWMTTSTTSNKSKARTANFIKPVEQQEQLAILGRTWNTRIHSWRMIDPLHKQCHPRSLLVVIVSAAAATSLLRAKRQLKVAPLKVKEWWVNLTIILTSQLPPIATSSPKAASMEPMNDKRSWPGPTISRECRASMIVFIITPSMEPWTKRLRGWLRWRNRRSFSTKECPRRNRVAFRWVSRCLMALKRIITLAICHRQAAHKRAKQCCEPDQWLERCRPQASTRRDCQVACGLSAI